ncbi:Hsp70 family protein [Frankia sp. CcWB2]
MTVTPGLVLGIDFGTWNSAVVIGRPDGSVLTIRDPSSSYGQTSFRTSVCGRPDGSLAVGAAAEHQRQQYPQYYRAEFKREFGTDIPSMLGARVLQPHDLAAEVLRFLRTCAEERIAGEGEPEQVVITVPASWQRARRDLMRRTAKVAGFDPARSKLVTEPSAAALHALSSTRLSETGLPVLVYDLGGGAFDRAILRLVRERLPQSVKVLDGDPDDEDVLRRRILLREDCERLKCTLATQPEAYQFLTVLDPPEPFTLTRGQLAEAVGPLIDRTLAECDLIRATAELSWDQIMAVVPAGGSCRLPTVTEHIQRHTGRPVVQVDDPDMAVALGAVAAARRLARESKHPDPLPSSARRPASPSPAEPSPSQTSTSRLAAAAPAAAEPACLPARPAHPTGRGPGRYMDPAAVRRRGRPPRRTAQEHPHGDSSRRHTGCRLPFFVHRAEIQKADRQDQRDHGYHAGDGGGGKCNVRIGVKMLFGTEELCRPVFSGESHGRACIDAAPGGQID